MFIFPLFSNYKENFTKYLATIYYDCPSTFPKVSLCCLPNPNENSTYYRFLFFLFYFVLCYHHIISFFIVKFCYIKVEDIMSMTQTIRHFSCSLSVGHLRLWAQLKGIKMPKETFSQQLQENKTEIQNLPHILSFYCHQFTNIPCQSKSYG